MQKETIRYPEGKGGREERSRESGRTGRAGPRRTRATGRKGKRVRSKGELETGTGTGSTGGVLWYSRYLDSCERTGRADG